MSFNAFSELDTFLSASFARAVTWDLQRSKSAGLSDGAEDVRVTGDAGDESPASYADVEAASL
jgi:hypothetical protein